MIKNASVEISGITLEHLNLHIQNQFTIQGVMSLLGFYGEYTICILSQSITIKVDLSKIYFAQGLVKMYKSTDEEGSRKYDGPLFYAELSTTDTRMTLQGLVKLLGVSSNVNMSISDGGYNFNFSGSILGVFDADVTARSAFGNPSETAFTVSGKYQQYFYTVLDVVVA